VKQRKIRVSFAKRARRRAWLTGIDPELVGSDLSDLDPTARLAQTRASGGGRTGRGGELAGATPNRDGVHDSECG
jgi:hypothetical protein